MLSSWLEPASHLLALGRSIDRDEESSDYGKPLVQTREYLLRNLLTARFGFADPAPAMACTPSVSPKVHRERELEQHVFQPFPSLEPVGSTIEQMACALNDRVYSCVTKLLDRKELLSNPSALKAVKAEADALITAGTLSLIHISEPTRPY